MRQNLPLLVLWLAACGGTPKGGSPAKVPTPPEPPPAEVAPSAPPREVPLLFSVKGRPFPLPLVRGRIRGISTLMAIDTGASAHVVLRWFARAAGVRSVSGIATGTDHAGRTFPAAVAEGLSLRVDDLLEVAPARVLVADGPAAYERLGIGAFLSPQALAGEGDVIVLDFARKRLAQRSVGEPDVGTLFGEPMSLGVSACEDPNGGGTRFLVDVEMEGEKGRLLVDTGAPRTDVLGESPFGKLLSPRSEESPVKWFSQAGPMETRTAKGVKFHLAGREIQRDIEILASAHDPSCARDGVLGMDVLSACVVTLTRVGLSARCKFGTD